MNRGFLLVVSGPSGVGKGTVLGRVRGQVDGVYFSISSTTRPMRPGEVEGEHYSYVDRDRFERMIENDELVEYTSYCGNYYGTPFAPVEKMLREGRVVVLEIETDGAAQIKAKYPDAVLAFVTTSGIEELSRRLVARGTESDQQIKNRLIRAKEEYKMAENFDYIIINDRLEQAVAELSAVISAERCKASRRLYIIKEGK